MNDITGKKILFLGASNYFLDAAKYAKSMGAYIIAVDYRPKEKAAVKNISDEHYEIDTTDFTKVLELAKKKKVDGIYAGASEVNIPVAIKICKELGLPTYCTEKQWEICTNKKKFKTVCKENKIPVTEEFEVSYPLIEDEIKQVPFPVVTKPTDNNGSTGITICNNMKDFYMGYQKAKEASKCGEILVEKCMEYEKSMIIHYTVQAGEILFCGLTDKESRKIHEDTAPVMSIQYMPSEYTQLYITQMDKKIRTMLKSVGILNGPIWIECFFSNNSFICNEIGYRYGGSLTYFPIEYFYGINQMKLILNYLTTGKRFYNKFANKKLIKEHEKDIYCILPVQLKAGIIAAIEGIEQLESMENVYEIVQSHVRGDVIEETGTTLQVFGYFHLVGRNKRNIIETIQSLKETLRVLDKNGNNMVRILYCL